MKDAHWEIEPYHSSDADICVLPAETEDDHRKALEYAENRLEELWDGMEIGQEATVKIRLCKNKYKDFQ